MEEASAPRIPFASRFAVSLQHSLKKEILWGFVDRTPRWCYTLNRGLAFANHYFGLFVSLNLFALVNTNINKGGILMPLTMARAGEVSIIRRVTGRDEVRRHLAELGFVVGAEVTVVNEIAGNMILSVKDSRVALDRDMATRIMI